MVLTLNRAVQKVKQIAGSRRPEKAFSGQFIHIIAKFATTGPTIAYQQGPMSPFRTAEFGSDIKVPGNLCRLYKL